MKKDQQKWNEKHRGKDYPLIPSPIVKCFYKMVVKGRALDIAAGKGRNSIFLAKQGFEVDALDISDVAMKGLGTYENITADQVDFDEFNLPRNRYNLIVNIKFLQRRLFPQIIEGLTDGGVLIFETFLVGQDGMHPDRHRREFMLRPNELLHAFLPLRILFYQENFSVDPEQEQAIASLVAVKN